MNERIYLITGAAGFLGGTICRQLLDRGEQVRALVLPGDRAIQYVPSGAEIVEGDLCDKAALERFFTVKKGYETIILHIASIVTVDPAYNKKVIDVNVGGTRNIIEVMKAHPECKKMVYCSSTGAIPELPKGEKITETTEFELPDPEKVVGCYSQSKARATELVLEAAREGLNACVVHPSGILGPEDYAIGETTSTLIKIINGEMPVAIDGTFNLCDVRDLAAGTIAAADKGERGECYILGNDEVSFKQFAQLVAEESNVKGVGIFLPIRMANFLATMMEKQAKKKGKKPVMTKFSVYNLARNNNFDSGKAKAQLGYHTRSYRETIHDEIHWLKERGMIA
ncbi:MAG: NAD-dependent epimerase/dehydratase family protein [Lachnospiraceae bacterium]|nr:NAD-dependent epimerase/dehydratase family protein [Lachnospiraceae bacterium]